MNRTRTSSRGGFPWWLGFLVFLAACGINPKPEAPALAVPSVTASPTLAPLEVPPTQTQAASPIPQPTAPLVLEAAAQEFTIPLHALHNSRDQVVLQFELDHASAGRIYWWTAAQSPHHALSMSLDETRSSHLITLSGLEPGEDYHFVVGLTGSDGNDRIPTFMGNLWPPLSIQTLSEDIFPLTVAVFGDSGFGEDLTAGLANDMATMDPDLVFHTGDLVYLAYQEGSPVAAYQAKWYQTLASILEISPVYPVVGNHEYDADATFDGAPYYFHAFPLIDELAGGGMDGLRGTQRDWYALELGSLQIIFLNSQQLYGGSGRGEQDTWLKARLIDDRFEASVVVFHVPPFTSGRHGQDGKAVISSWVPEFEASNVVLVLSGHDHNYERIHINGITYVVSGGGSSVLYPLGDRIAGSSYFAARSHYLLMRLAKTHITIEAIGLDGEIFDSHTVEIP